MTYTDAIQYLYDHAPMFQQIGRKAYKSGLENTLMLDEHFGHPHRCYKTIHVAGTNGKGSTSHLLASVLQCAGYRVGLYTSPHLHDFRERIRIDGEMITEQHVIDFIDKNKPLIDTLQPSFFEITTAMAFAYFAEQKVDAAVIEVGLGGRLDCTNIITPVLSVITNISLDHTDILGDTLEKIAAEKAGIIKQGVPVVIGETQAATASLFEARAAALGAPITFADQTTTNIPPDCPLEGIYQAKNKRTASVAIDQLRTIGFSITERNIADGFEQVLERTHLAGRWQTIGEHPQIVCDTGHNEGGMRYVAEQLKRQPCAHLHIVFGMVSDKDHEAVLALLPTNATYYFTKAQSPRAWSETELQRQAATFGLTGRAYASVRQAFEAAKNAAAPDDFIFVGGSNYVVAEII